MRASVTEKSILLICALFTFVKTVNSIHCYQCSGTDSDNSFECNEFLESDVTLQAIDCGTLHDAQYCIKHVGRNEGITLDCYQCNSSTTLECAEGLMHLDGGILTPTSCDHVFEAQYCIKKTVSQHSRGHTSALVACNILACVKKQQGGITTSRYCSSLDLGNFCNYVQQPGDKLEYRTCIYTCGSDGCNSATAFRIPAVVLIIGVLLGILW